MSENQEQTLAEVLLNQIRAERELGERLDEFKDEWVAVRDHAVVAHAPTLDELMDRIDVDDVDAVLEVSEVHPLGPWYNVRAH